MAKLSDDEATPALAGVASAVSQESETEDVPDLLDADPDGAELLPRAVFIDPTGQNPAKLGEIVSALLHDSELTTIRLYAVAGSPGLTRWRQADQTAGLLLKWEDVQRFQSVSVRSGIATHIILDVVDLLENSTTAVYSVCLWTSDPSLGHLVRWIRRRYGIGVVGVSTTKAHKALQNACSNFLTFEDSEDSAQRNDADGENDTQWVEDVSKAVTEISSRRGSKWVPYTDLGGVLRRNGVDYATEFGSLGRYLERGVKSGVFKRHVQPGQNPDAPVLLYLALTKSHPPVPPTAQDLQGRTPPSRRFDQNPGSLRDRSARRDDYEDRRRGGRDDYEDRRRGGRDDDYEDRRRGGRDDYEDRRRGGRDDDYEDRRRGGRDDYEDRRRGGRDDDYEDRRRE